MKNISITRLFGKDWHIYRDTRLRALEDSPDAFGSTLAREKNFAQEDWKLRLERTECITLVATSPDNVGIGLIVGGPYDSHVGIFSMWVDPEFRGFGIANELIRRIIDWAEFRNEEQILLDVGDLNIHAINLYKRNGFEPTGITGTLPSPRDYIKEHQRSKKLNANKSAHTTPAIAPR